MKHLSYTHYERALPFFGGNNHKIISKSMSELTFAEIALSFCGYIYKEHILKISSRHLKNHGLRYLISKTIY